MTSPGWEQAPEPCSYRPQVGDRYDIMCRSCGHLVALHVGADTCPVCRLEAALLTLTSQPQEAPDD